MRLGGLIGGLVARRKIIVLMALTVFAYLAAINRGQAFFWLIPALLLATVLTGLLWPYWLIRQLKVQRRGASRAEEGESLAFEISVENPGWLPRFMVEVVDYLPFVGLSGPDGGNSRKLLGMLAFLPGRRRETFSVSVICEKRGFYHLGPVGLASSFPLGLTEATTSSEHSRQSLTIYPSLFRILSLPLHGAPSQIHRGGYLLPEGSGAAEFSGLREYRRGDNPRHVHWPTTARLNELMVREYEPLASACLYLLLDQAAAANLGQGKEATFEYAVRIAASMARTACQQNMRTRIAGSAGLRCEAGSGDAHFERLLDELAVVDCQGAQSYSQLLQDIGPLCLRGETVVLFLSEAPAHWPSTLQALSILRARQVHLFAIMFEPGSFAPTAANDLAPLEASLLELGAQCLRVRQGDDLLKLFNP